MEIKPNNIYCGDCYELIKLMPDKSVDGIYTDPPYLYDSGFGKRLKEQGKITESTEKHIKEMSNGVSRSLLDEFVRVMKYIYIYIWCNDKQIIDYMNYFVNEKGCNYKILAWHKTNPMPMYAKRFVDDIEYCLLFVEKDKQKFFGEDTYQNSFKVFSAPINMFDKEKYKHSSIKPYECVKNHLQKSFKKGQLILDPFAGTSTTLVACKDLGINYIGFEKDKHWYEVSLDRLNNIDQNGNVSLFNL